MATNTVPAAAPGPPDPPAQAPANATTGQPPKSFLAAMVAPVEPARPTSDPVPAGGAGEVTPGLDGVLDRSAPGVSSASFRGAAEEAAKASDPTGARAKKSIWKEFWLAAATRWAKGGGAANKRLDLAKARAQAKAHQVKENRTTTVAKSGGLPVRNTGGSGAGTNKGSDKSGNNSSGHKTNGSSRGASGGGRGLAGGSGNNGSGSGAGRGSGGAGGGKDSGSSPKQSKGNQTADGAGGRGGRSSNGSGGTGSDSGKKNSGSSWSTDGKDGQSLAPASGGKSGGKPDAKGSGNSPAGKGAGGPAGKAGAAGKDGAAGKAGSGTDSKGPKDSTDPKDSSKKVNLTKDPKDPKDPKAGDPNSKNNGTGKGHQPVPQKTPLEKARETGHGDGTKARRVVDHVVAYKDGVVDGWGDEKTKNEKEHDRLDKAHDTHKPKTGDSPKPIIVTEKGDDGVTTDVKPLNVKTIDANTLTLDTAGGVRGTVGRRELRNFKQYERKLEAKETVLQKIAEACAQLQKQAEDEATDCQRLAEQGKGVKGGEKLVATLDRLAEAAKNQAVEAAELTKRAQRAAEMCKVVLTNIQTRYAPLYQAVVDSDEIKPGEMRFYNDKGVYRTAA